MVSAMALVLGTVVVLFAGGIALFVGLFAGMGPKGRKAEPRRDRDRST